MQLLSFQYKKPLHKVMISAYEDFQSFHSTPHLVSLEPHISQLELAHTIMQAFDFGECSNIVWPILTDLLWNRHATAGRMYYGFCSPQNIDCCTVQYYRSANKIGNRTQTIYGTNLFFLLFLYICRAFSVASVSLATEQQEWRKIIQ